MRPYSPQMPETDKLPRKLVTREEFRDLADAAGWPREATDLYLQRPCSRLFVAIGEKGARVLALVVEPMGL